MATASGSILALDVGERRIGVARAHTVARIASPLITLEHTEQIFDDIRKLVDEHEATVLVVGMPRGLNGQRTAQTEYVQRFFLELQQHLSIPLYWQDEALTSQKAEAELQARGVPYKKGDIDALAATYILEDFLSEHPEESI